MYTGDRSAGTDPPTIFSMWDTTTTCQERGQRGRGVPLFSPEHRSSRRPRLRAFFVFCFYVLKNSFQEYFDLSVFFFFFLFPWVVSFFVLIGVPEPLMALLLALCIYMRDPGGKLYKLPRVWMPHSAAVSFPMSVGEVEETLCNYWAEFLGTLTSELFTVYGGLRRSGFSRTFHVLV